jgi:hypothetical protein
MPLLLRASLAVLALLTLRQWAVHPGLEGDTFALVKGAQSLLACGLHSPCPGAQHFPLFQHLLAMPLLQVGLSVEMVVKALAALSLVAWVALFMEIKGPLARAVLFTGPLWVYATSSFGEMAAALLTVCFVRGALEGNRRQIATYGLLAGITKEIAWPFLLALGLWTLRKRLRSHGGALAAGLGAAIASNALFNSWRFGSFQNTFLLQPHFQTPDLATHASFTAGLWLSPNGGWVVFWPAFAVLVVLALRDPAKRATTIVVLALLDLLTLGLGRWFAPMGWVAWGPRLLLPWIPAFILLLGDVAWPRRQWVWTPALAIGTAHIVSLMSFAPKDRLFDPTPECPSPVAIEASAHAYYNCIRHLTWPWRSFALLDAWREAFARPLHLVAVVAFLAAAFAYSRVKTER